jgi:hypothetical protein
MVQRTTDLAKHQRSRWQSFTVLSPTASATIELFSLKSGLTRSLLQLPLLEDLVVVDERPPSSTET